MDSPASLAAPAADKRAHHDPGILERELGRLCKRLRAELGARWVAGDAGDAGAEGGVPPQASKADAGALVPSLSSDKVGCNS